MKRHKPLLRKTPLRSNPEKTRLWKNQSRVSLTRSKEPMRRRSTKRAKQERSYSSEIASFLAAHPICPVTNEKTSEIHHSAKRWGEWLNLKRYWIALSLRGHKWVEDHKEEAKEMGLMVRIRETFKEHYAKLLADGIDPNEPLYYSR